MALFGCSVWSLMTSPPSLRDLYIDPSSAWSFSAPVLPEAANGTAAASSSAPIAQSFQWSSRPTHNSIFDLSPEINEAYGVDAIDLLKTLAASAILQYTSTAIAMPWEVGKLLLQVQWVPRNNEEIPPAEPDDDEDAVGVPFDCQNVSLTAV